MFQVLMADVFPKWKIGVLTLMSSNQNKWKEIRITEYHNKVGEPQKTQGVSKATWDKKTSDNQTNRKNEKQYLHCHEFERLNGEGTQPSSISRCQVKPWRYIRYSGDLHGHQRMRQSYTYWGQPSPEQSHTERTRPSCVMAAGGRGREARICAQAPSRERRSTASAEEREAPRRQLLPIYTFLCFWIQKVTCLS